MRFLGSNHSSGAIGQSQRIFLLIPSKRKIITQTAPGLSHVVSVFPALTFATFTFPLISFDLYLAAIGLDKVVGFSEGLGPFPIGVNRSHDVFSDLAGYEAGEQPASIHLGQIRVNFVSLH